MKKTLIALSLVALMGAGCTNTPTKAPAATNPFTAPTTQTDATVNGQPLPPPSEPSKEVKPSVEITTVPTKSSPTSDADIPVTDIYLGEAQVKVNMEVSNFAFSPAVINAKVGNAVQITFTKVEGTHTFIVDGTNASFNIAQGEKDIFTAPSKPGSYQFYCNIPGHKEKGMVGTLLVK